MCDQIASDIQEPAGQLAFEDAVSILRQTVAANPEKTVVLRPRVVEALLEGLRSVGSEKRRDDGGGGLQRPHA